MYTLNCRGRLLVLDQPVVMGILNITPDSFFAESRKTRLEEIIIKAQRMISEGAKILDIGAQSTRPGSTYLTPAAEWERLEPVLSTLIGSFPDCFFSIDTFHASVAEKSYAAGVHMVNDISGGQMDPSMLSVVGATGLPYICMHMKGTPQTMQSLAHYDDLLLELTDYFLERKLACEHAGIQDLVLDPGFGFAKTIDHNFELLRRLGDLKVLSLPLLIGLSRKSMITKTLGIPASEALNGTSVLNTLAVEKGAHILRVHDVRAAVEVLKLVRRVDS